MKNNTLILLSESKTLLLGSALSKICIMGCVIYLNGDVGTGKTIFCKGFLRGLGYLDHVKSPTYTLIESYFLSNIDVHHCDCYRLCSTEEFINTGIQEYYDSKSIFLIEWPKKNIKILPDPDIIITINYFSVYEQYRKVLIQSVSKIGQEIISIFLNTKIF